MIVNSINNRINPAIILSNNKVSIVQLPSAKPSQTSDSLQKQMNFMGLANSPIIKQMSLVGLSNSTIIKEYSSHTNSTALKLLDKLSAQMKHFELTKNMTLLRVKNSNKDNTTPIILLKTPMKFYDSLNTLGLSGYHSKTSFEEYKEAIQKTPDLKNTSILGIVGQGTSSTAFLSESGNVIKLSKYPNFPSPKEFIKNLEVPILKRYIVDLQNGQKIYGAEEMFAEDATIRGISLEEYNKIFDKFSETLKNANPNYSFKDFFYNNFIYFDQLGFVNDTPYLIDHECIRGRELMK